MNLQELKKLVENTADAAFAIDKEGLVIAWNKACQELVGMASESALGQICGQLLHGQDECGQVCSSDCPIKQAIREHRPIRNFDLQIKVADHFKWVNASVLIIEMSNSYSLYALYILRQIDMRKRLEMLMRDFIQTEVQVTKENHAPMIADLRMSAGQVNLSTRELDVLNLLAKGASSDNIANELYISRTTVNNHIQHILHKLNAHSRLEAIRRAELAGLLSLKPKSEKINRKLPVLRVVNS
ncbi:MAG: LuxR C-terminal-related transcriptional regulator [Acidobacteriota bacterium]